MEPPTDHAPTRGQRWHLGAAVGVTALSAVSFAATLTTGEATASRTYFALSLVATWALWALLRRSPVRLALLAWPLLVVLGLLGASEVSPVAATLCTGTVVIAFVFVGLTQRQWTSLLLWPLTVPTLWSVIDLQADRAIVRIALAMLVWLSVAELPAWLTARLRVARMELRELASTDPLTGLANRRRWEDFFRTALAGRTVSVLLLDLDHFKRYNDAHGHLAGDELLVELAAALEETVGASGLVARWGGEEFAVALPGARLAEGMAIAERIRAVVPHGQTCSVGAATRQFGDDARSLMDRADRALYEAKQSGRDRVVAA